MLALTTRPPGWLRDYRPIISLAGPIAGIQLAQVALTTVDLAMMGLLSVTAIAAGGLAILLYNQLRTMSVGMVTGIGNQIAAAAGAGERRTGTDELDDRARDEIRDLLRAGLGVATLVAVIAAGVLIGLGCALPLFGQRDEVVAVARPMMIALAPGLIPMLWLNVLRQFAVGMRRPGSLLRVTIVSIAVNAALDAAFIYGWLGLPELGATGVGLATTLVQVFTLVSFHLQIRRDEHLTGLVAADWWNLDRATAREIVKMGTPIAFTYGNEAAITSVATMLMGAFGPALLAASNVVNQLAYIVYQLNIGLSQGSSILVSRSIGRGDRAEAGHIARRALTVAAAAMTVIAVLYCLAPHAVLALFLHSDSAEVVATASALLWFAIAHQYLKGAQNICVGLLRGLGNTTSSLRITLIGYWGIGIPTMLAAAYLLHWRGYGIWLGLCAGFGATAILLARQFRADLRSA
ncbi:putative multidrug and toxic compound extrusion transporter [Nocardia nova SH22a]|uniref:Probable multidrug resistance protein NorM n=1 Tax=Nocardia nova SH22a TaxID=1415166 RepID=W5TL42_9NOCA|nr:MATE family efflux transporter [Nocardia nova]AHH17936.1 putative multidrug and toxic compound extrusion transporter [Nocardia nova SH22a]